MSKKYKIRETQLKRIYDILNEQDTPTGKTSYDTLLGKGSSYAKADITVTDPNDPLLVAYKLAKNLNYTYYEFVNEVIHGGYQKIMMCFIDYIKYWNGSRVVYGDCPISFKTNFYKKFEVELADVWEIAKKYKRIYDKLINISNGSMGEDAQNYVLGMMPKFKIFTVWDAVLSTSDNPIGDKWLTKEVYDYIFFHTEWTHQFGYFAIGPKFNIIKKVELVDTPPPTEEVPPTPEPTPVPSVPKMKPFCIGGKFIRQNNSYPVAIICSKEKQVYYFPSEKSFTTFKTTPEWVAMSGELDYSGGSFPTNDYNKVKGSVSNANETKTVSDRSYIPGIQGTIEKIWYNPTS